MAENKDKTAKAAAAAVDDGDEAPKLDETQHPGGVYVVGATRKGGKHFGGKVVNAVGETLAEFDDKQENTGPDAVTLGPDGVPLTLQQQQAIAARAPKSSAKGDK